MPAAAPALIDSLIPAVRYATRHGRTQDPTGQSRIGGDPDLPTSVEWPTWLPGPLRFFIQVNLEEAHAAAPGPLELPPAGLLSFFADFDDEGNGITGLYGDEREGCRVLYTPRGITVTPRRSPVKPLTEARLYALGAWTWSMNVELLDDEYVAIDQLDREYETQMEVALPEGYALAGRHQLGGNARFIQHPVEEEVVQAVDGCYDQSGRFDYQRWLRVKDHVTQWRTLMQLDSDETLGFMWGDVGTLYWAIRKDGIKRNDWSSAMFNFQCS